MPYMYEVRFNISADAMEQLQIGAALQRVLGYLKVLLPASQGFIHSQGMHSVEVPGRIDLVVTSLWEFWDDLELHRKSRLAEDKILHEFAPHVEPRDLQIETYEMVS